MTGALTLADAVAAPKRSANDGPGRNARLGGIDRPEKRSSKEGPAAAWLSAGAKRDAKVLLSRLTTRTDIRGRDPTSAGSRSIQVHRVKLAVSATNPAATDATPTRTKSFRPPCFPRGAPQHAASPNQHA